MQNSTSSIDFKKYKRFFAFGCSFTTYSWPTWADIIAKEIPDHYIYAKPGAGNFYMFQALMEAIIRHKINKDDLVMIMFTNITREDRFIKNKGWITPGNLYHQTEYSQEFLKKHLCHHGYLMRDLNLAQGCKLALENTGCDYDLLSMVPFDSEQSNEKKIDHVDYILQFYKNIIESVRPSVLDVVFNNDWESRPHRPEYFVRWQKEKFKDSHPTPAEHLEFLQYTYTNIEFSKSTLEFVNTYNEVVLSKNFDNDSGLTFSKNLYPRLGN
jgi:hypothetical protein